MTDIVTDINELFRDLSFLTGYDLSGEHKKRFIEDIVNEILAIKKAEYIKILRQESTLLAGLSADIFTEREELLKYSFRNQLLEENK